jgi:predicted nucleotidyltransferase
VRASSNAKGGMVHDLVEAKRAEVQALCRRFGVRRLDVFGSAVSESFDPAASDIDVLVEFEAGPDFDYVASYFGLKEGLEELLRRPVDLVTVTSIRNPFFRAEVMRTRETLYAA